MKRAVRLVFAGVLLYLSWMGMMAVHESGHVLAGWLGGGHVGSVKIPLVGFSETYVEPNPSPRLEVWGGPVWGCVLPLVVWLIVRNRYPKPVNVGVGFFAGFCLVANGAYLGMGWKMRTGDAADLVRLGTPAWVLVVFGMIVGLVGIYIWDGLGRVVDLFRA